MAETYYERLGVAPNASADAVEDAYRARLKQVHPDVSDDPAAAERTRRLIEAKRVLTDDHERAVYDRIGHANYTAEDEETDASADSTDTSTESADAATRPEDAGSSGGSGTDRERRHRRNRQTRAAWNPWADVAGGVSAQHEPAWNSGRSYRVYPADASQLGRRLFPVGPSVALLFVAFCLYPVLLWGAVEPAFPLAFNLVLGSCLVVFVGFFLSIPAVAIGVFGAWTVLLPAGLLAAGVYSGPVWFVAAVGTLIPLALATVVWAVLRA